MPTKRLAAHGTVRGVFFSLGTTPSHDPQLDCAKAIIDLFNAARKTAHVAIFTLTERRIVDAMIAARKRGVTVAVVTDAEQSQSPENAVQKQMIEKLRQAGVAVQVAVKQAALLHNEDGSFGRKSV